MSHLGKVQRYLRDNRVPHRLHHHDTDGLLPGERGAPEHVRGQQYIRTVVVVADGSMAMLAAPAPYEIDMGRVAEILGAREVRLASAEEVAARCEGCDIDHLPPLGSVYDLPVLVDISAAENREIVFQVGSPADTMVMNYGDFERIVRPQIGEFARPPVALRGPRIGI